MKKISGILTVMLLFIAATAFSQKADLKLKLKKGESYVVKMTMDNDMTTHVMGQEMPMKQLVEFKMFMNVVDKLPNGNYSMTQTYGAMKVEMNVAGQDISIDTENDDDQAAKQLSALKNAVISFEVSPSGEVTNVSGYDDLMTSLGSNPQMAQTMQGLMNEETMVNFFQYLPGKKVDIGDDYTKEVKLKELMNANASSKFKVTSLSADHIGLNQLTDLDINTDEPIEQHGMKFDMTASGLQTGTFKVSRENGMIESSNGKMDMTMDMTTNNPQGEGTMTIKLNLKAVIKTEVTKK